MVANIATIIMRNFTGTFGFKAHDGAWTFNGPFRGANWGEGCAGRIDNPGYHSATFNPALVVPTATENRPINKAVRYLIKAA